MRYCHFAAPSSLIRGWFRGPLAPPLSSKGTSQSLGRIYCQAIITDMLRNWWPNLWYIDPRRMAAIFTSSSISNKTFVIMYHLTVSFILPCETTGFFGWERRSRSDCTQKFSLKLNYPHISTFSSIRINQSICRTLLIQFWIYKVTQFLIGWKHQVKPIRSCFNNYPNKSCFLRVCSTRLLKTQGEKEKLLVTSNFSFFTVFSNRLDNFLPFS